MNQCRYNKPASGTARSALGHRQQTSNICRPRAAAANQLHIAAAVNQQDRRMDAIPHTDAHRYKRPVSKSCSINYIHTHPFNGPFSGTTQVSRYQKGKTHLDFTGARDSEWQTDASTPPLCSLQAGCPSCHPTNSVKALKANQSTEGYCCTNINAQLRLGLPTGKLSLASL